MSTQWMKHTLIASVLTVLMTLPAVAQQRRLSGPAKPASVTPGKLEVPKKFNRRLGMQYGPRKQSFKHE